jgi:hypothetical protein
VDQQDIFRNQWYKRRAYYVKQNYDILMTDSPTYDAHNPVEWTPDHVAKIKGLNLNEANTKASKTKALEDDAKAKAKGWAGIPIM